MPQCHTCGKVFFDDLEVSQLESDGRGHWYCDEICMEEAPEEEENEDDIETAEDFNRRQEIIEGGK